MTTFASIVADVYTCTNKPHLVAETELAVKSATLRAHRMDFFSKDLYETGISFPSAAYLQSLDYRTLLPRWRQMKYLRKYDATGAAAGMELTAIPIEKVLDSYNQERVDVFYLAGDVYQIKSSTEEQYYLLGAYLNPSVDSTAYVSWIADEYPYAIIYDAASLLLKQIHQDDLAKQFADSARIEFAELIAANIETVGS